MVLPPGEQHGLNQGFLGHIELGQCRKCNYSLKRTQTSACLFSSDKLCRINSLGGGLGSPSAFLVESVVFLPGGSTGLIGGLRSLITANYYGITVLMVVPA